MGATRAPRPNWQTLTRLCPTEINSNLMGDVNPMSVSSWNFYARSNKHSSLNQLVACDIFIDDSPLLSRTLREF